MSEYIQKKEHQQTSKRINQLLQAYIEPLLQELDAKIDKRLVRTFYKTLQVIIQFRHRSNGLLLSELGGYILDPAQAPAGTKRISNLLRSTKWGYEIIEEFLWRKATSELAEIASQGEEVLAAWDESVLEKPESIALEGLCAVRSSKARRLKRIKPGYFNPPGGRPICVPGMNWVTVMVLGMKRAPSIAAMRWWTTRGKFSSDKRTEEIKLLNQCVKAWGSASCMCGIVVSAGGPGYLRPAIPVSVSSCVGKKVTNYAINMVKTAKLGKSRAGNVPGNIESSGIIGAVAFVKPGSMPVRSRIRSILVSFGWSFLDLARDGLPGIS